MYLVDSLDNKKILKNIVLDTCKNIKNDIILKEEIICQFMILI